MKRSYSIGTSNIQKVSNYVGLSSNPSVMDRSFRSYDLDDFSGVFSSLEEKASNNTNIWC